MAPNLKADHCYAFFSPQGDYQRGEIISFREDKFIFVFRLIGLPGDTVEMRSGRLYLNGQAVETRPYDGPLPDCDGDRHCDGEWLVETLPGGPSYLIIDFLESTFDDTPPVLVPDGKVFVLGDNRDNAADSRIPVAASGRGLISIEDIQRRVEIEK